MLHVYICITCMPDACEEECQIDRAFVIGVTDGCELNPGPLQEKQIFLTTESSLEPHNDYFLDKNILWIRIVLL